MKKLHLSKKIILSTICGGLALLMVGCSTSSSAQTTKDLSTQVERMQKTVTGISTSAVYDVTPSNYLYSQPYSETNTSESRLKALMTNSQSAFAEHEALRNEIMNRSATLKSALGQKYKLSNSKVKALKTLTSTISGYSSDITNTTHMIKSATGYIKRNKTNQNLSADNLNVGYTQLNNELEKRITYFKNVLSAFDQVESILNSSLSNEEKNSSTETQTQQYTQDNNSNPAQTSRFTKNIDTYVTNPGNENVVNQNNSTAYNQAYRYNGYGNNGYGYNGYGYNRFYGYGRGFSPFNPSRNTDTYLPTRRNIDTYRPNTALPEYEEVVPTSEMNTQSLSSV